MKHFTIENETNNIMIHGSAKEADAVPNTERFSNEVALAKLAANWPAGRLVEIYNSLPGETQVKKFKDRATAVSRIWKAIQNLGETVPAAQEAALIPEEGLVVELPKLRNRTRAFLSLWNPPWPRPFRHSRPTSRRRRLPRRRGPSGQRKRPQPRLRKKPVRLAKAAKRAR